MSIDLTHLLAHAVLGSATATVITKSYLVPLVGFYTYWTLHQLTLHLDAAPGALLEYWTAGPSMAILGVLIGAIISHLFSLPRLVDALLLPNDYNKQRGSGVRTLNWEVHLFYLFTFLIFLGIKFIAGSFSDDSTSTLDADVSLGIGITLVAIAGIGLLVNIVIAVIGKTHRFEKRQNIKYMCLILMMVCLPLLLAILVLPLPSVTWWSSLAYFAIVALIYLFSILHTGKFTFFAGVYDRASSGFNDESYTTRPFFTDFLTYDGGNATDRESLLDEEETAVHDNMVNVGNMTRFFLTLFVLNALIIFVDWVALYWLCVTSVVTHSITLAVVGVLFIVAVIVTYFILNNMEKRDDANRAYPAGMAGRVQQTVFTVAGYYARLKSK